MNTEWWNCRFPLEPFFLLHISPRISTLVPQALAHPNLVSQPVCLLSYFLSTELEGRSFFKNAITFGCFFSSSNALPSGTYHEPSPAPAPIPTPTPTPQPPPMLVPKIPRGAPPKPQPTPKPHPRPAPIPTPQPLPPFKFPIENALQPPRLSVSVSLSVCDVTPGRMTRIKRKGKD